MNEYTLIDQSKKGDREAFCDLYEIYRTRLYRYAFYRLKNEADAEDAVSECILSAWRQIGNLRDAKAFPAWIFRILNGACSRIMVQQIDRRRQVSLDDGDADPADGQRAQDHSVRLILREALEQISEEDQNILLLSAVAGLSSAEIGDLTGMPPGTVRSRISRGTKKMREFMERE